MLIKILQNLHNQIIRAEIAEDAQKTLADFRAGKYQPQSAKSLISELRQLLNHEDNSNG
ncbi:MAG: hypothetical protein AAFR37_09635 [Cyanobacteria bacterium J06628_3]